MQRILYTFFISFIALIPIVGQTLFERDINFNTWLPFQSNSNAFGGAAWGDLNGDELTDIIVGPNAVFFNNGDGTFTRDLTTIIGAGFFVFANNVTGVTMADIDNDDDLDVFINCSRPFAAASNRDMLYLNDGNGVFSADTLGPWNPLELSWGASWADYNNDGYVDLVAAHPAGFIGTPRPSTFSINIDGNPANFMRDTTYGFTKTLAPYTVPYWSDYDMDGDQDLFIASGPGGVPGLDSNYTNQLTETGTASFTTNQDPFTDSLQDGQCYNFVDYDNDGDKDLFITNWGGATNNFYQNENGSYVPKAMPFSYNNTSLTNAWGDFDNDADLDVLITNHNSGLTEVWLNESDSFILSGDELCNQFGNSGAILADADNDGFLDFYVTGANRAAGIYYNLAPNSNHWMGLTLKGNPSNRAAIGANVRIVATIDGEQVSQLREVSAQNAFQGHHDLRLHVGLKSATVADSIYVYWPSGKKEFFLDQTADQFYTIIEGDGMDVNSANEESAGTLASRLSIYPNPTKDSLTIKLSQPGLEIKQMGVYNMQGKLMQEISWNNNLHQEVDISKLASGSYFLHVINDGNRMFAKKFVKN